MKKFFSLICLVVLLGVSANVMGQSTGATPYPGAQHYYQVNGGTTGANTYEWKVFKDVANVLTDVTGTDATVSLHTPDLGITGANVFIKWKNTLTVGDVYFVQVKESNLSCTNTKAFKVTISLSTFDLAMSVTSTTACYTSDVAVSSASFDPVYTHGASTVVYTVTPTGLSSGQSYSFTVAPPASADFTTGVVSVSGAGSAAGNVITVTDNNLVTLTYVITKALTTSNTDAAGTGALLTSTASIATGTGVSNLGVASLETAAQTKTITVDRPHTSNITSPN